MDARHSLLSRPRWHSAIERSPCLDKAVLAHNWHLQVVLWEIGTIQLIQLQAIGDNCFSHGGAQLITRNRHNNTPLSLYCSHTTTVRIFLSAKVVVKRRSNGVFMGQSTWSMR